MKKIVKLLSATLLTVLTAVMLLACAPADLDKAEEKMEEAGYTCMEMTGNDLADFVPEEEIDSVSGVITGVKLDDQEDAFYAIIFKDEASAKDVMSDASTDDMLEGFVVKQEGKWVFMGSETAYDAFMA